MHKAHVAPQSALRRCKPSRSALRRLHAARCAACRLRSTSHRGLESDSHTAINTV